MPIQHRPMSEILAPAADPAAVAPTDDKSAATPETAKVDPPAVPEKYSGKTVDQVIEMHQNSEKRLGQLQNEVGSLRGLVTDLSTIQRPAAEPQPAEQEPVDVSGDDILRDPVGSVRAIVKQDFDKQEEARVTSATQTLFETEGRALVDDYGDIDAIVSTDDFQTFATRTPSRHADFQVAATGEGIAQVRAARRLLEDYTDFKAQTTPAQDPAPTPVEQARAAATESGSVAAPISGKPQVFETDVIKLINSDRAKYQSPSFQKELTEAIKEGRYVKAG